jgi:hypothetical protein
VCTCCEENRLGLLDDDDDGLRLIDDQAVAAVQDHTPRKGKAEGDPAVRPPPSVHPQAVVPSERHGRRLA